jgi:predicted nucleic acid-binding protein
MKRVLVDVNVVLDVLLDRQPHAAASIAVWTAIETGHTEGLLAAHAITTIHYLVRKELGAAKAKRTLTSILRVFGVAPVDSAVIEDAIKRVSPDFEDSVMISAARLAGCDLIITRDPRGFRDSPVRVLTPETAVPLLSIP